MLRILSILGNTPEDSMMWLIFFDVETLNMIRRIPIGMIDQPDRVIWPWSSCGKYTVKQVAAVPLIVLLN